MRRILICSGVRSRPKALDWLRHAVEVRRPDAVLFAGGVLDTARHYAPRVTEWGLTHDDARFLEKFFAAVGNLGVFSALIPGPFDTPLEDFLRMGMHAELDFPTLHLVHATLVEKEDVAICGVGGGICEGPSTEPDLLSRALVEYHLRPLWTARQSHKILLLPAPPTGPLGGDQGCTLAGDLIDSYHPSLCAVAGPSERRGVQRIAHTLVVNPGCLADGWAAWLDWTRPAADQVEFLDLRHLDLAHEEGEKGPQASTAKVVGRHHHL